MGDDERRRFGIRLSKLDDSQSDRVEHGNRYFHNDTCQEHMVARHPNPMPDDPESDQYSIVNLESGEIFVTGVMPIIESWIERDFH